ncbi:hypothetical protein [Brevibacterium ihuae]|uniref:hypothetical protein n=1 Tax=Brevibacterium ihuae TaxID=1631743 RepID=UPI0015E09EAA|nr:hypothetical protein [Brevibacterium ihuae]
MNRSHARPICRKGLAVAFVITVAVLLAEVIGDDAAVLLPAAAVEVDAITEVEGVSS